MINRRSVITGLAAAFAAPAIIRTPGILMPIKPLLLPEQVIIPVDVAVIPNIGLPKIRDLLMPGLIQITCGVTDIDRQWDEIFKNV